MKKTVVTLMLVFAGIHVFAQQDTPEEMMAGKPPVRTAQAPVLYITTGTGINNTTGIIGFNFELPVAKYVSIDAGAGLGTWGSKVYLGGKYYLRPDQRGLAFSVGLTHSTGYGDYKQNMETVYSAKEPVTLHLFPQTNVLFAAYRYFNLGSQYNRFFVGAGWSVNVSSKKWNETAGEPLTDDSKDRINAMLPGGPMAMVGFSFGLSRK